MPVAGLRTLGFDRFGIPSDVLTQDQSGSWGWLALLARTGIRPSAATMPLLIFWSMKASEVSREFGRGDQE